MFKLMKCTILNKNKVILNLMASTRLQQVGTRPCSPLCSIPYSFNNSLYPKA